MAILAVGGSGYVGLHLLQAFAKHWSPDDIAYTYNTRCPVFVEQLGRSFLVDFATGEGMTALSTSVNNPKVVINCAAMSVPRECELDSEKAMAVNVPRYLLTYLAGLSCRPPLLIHLSTDQVYEGTKQFYVEEDDTNAVNVYGKTKVAAEEFIRSNWCNFVIFRSSIIYGPQPAVPVQKTLPIQWIDKVLSTGKPVDFFEDEYRCPVFIHDLVKAIELMMSRYLHDGKPLQLVLNLGGPERLSRSEMAEVVARVRRYHPSLVNRVSAKSVDRGVASPADISMNVDKLRKVLNITLTPFAEGVNQTLRA